MDDREVAVPVSDHCRRKRPFRRQAWFPLAIGAIAVRGGHSCRDSGVLDFSDCTGKSVAMNRPNLSVGSIELVEPEKLVEALRPLLQSI